MKKIVLSSVMAIALTVGVYVALMGHGTVGDMWRTSFPQPDYSVFGASWAADLNAVMNAEMATKVAVLATLCASGVAVFVSSFTVAEVFTAALTALVGAYAMFCAPLLHTLSGPFAALFVIGGLVVAYGAAANVAEKSGLKKGWVVVMYVLEFATVIGAMAVGSREACVSVAIIGASLVAALGFFGRAFTPLADPTA